jgi:phosphoesterase RecJ-like protein
LGRALSDAGKEAILLVQKALEGPLTHLKDTDRLVNYIDTDTPFDVAVALDCAEKKRLGDFVKYLDLHKLTVNIDHHETNDGFADINLIAPTASCTGELVFRILKMAGFSICTDVASNLFAAVQTDTGSFRYTNTSPSAMRMGAELIESGARPWEISREVMDGYDASRLRLLELALGTLEFHFHDRLGMMTIRRHMFERTGSSPEDSERFVDYPRFVYGVEVAAVLRETGKDRYKFSLRSDQTFNVANLAATFGGGGHKQAAGFECRGSVDQVKRTFLKTAGRILDEDHA